MFLLSKHDPQMRKKCYLHQAQIMRHRVKKMMIRMIITSLERNIEEKRGIIEKVERDQAKS
jgi:chromosomal replication initiation ATPase DnaA